MRPALLTLLFLPAAAAAGPDPAAVAPYLDPLTVAVAHVDASKIDPDAVAGKLADLAGLTAAERDAVRAEIAPLKDRVTKAGGRDVYAVGTLADGMRTPWFLVIPGADPAVVGGVRGTAAVRVGGAAVVGSPATVARLQAQKPTPRPDLAAAFAAAGDSAARMAVLPPDELRKSAEELLPTLPPQAGGGPTRALTQGVRWVAAGIELTPKLSARMTVQAADAGAAKALVELYDRVRGAVAEAAVQAVVRRPGDLGDVLPAAALLGLMKLVPAGDDRLAFEVTEAELVPVAKPLIGKVRSSAARSQSTNQLKQLGLVMHNYHDTYRSLPTQAIRSKDGKPLLSWRVAALPFVDENTLYKEFRLDEPWDSEHNKKLIPRMPRVFRSPFQASPAGTTTYFVPVGDATLFPPTGPGVLFKDCGDGLSNTLMLVEADDARAVPWTKPDDLLIDPKKPFEGLRVVEGGVILAAFGDGSVRAISTAVGDKTLNLLFTRNDGQVIPDF